MQRYCANNELLYFELQESSMVRDTGRIKIERFKHQSQLQFRPVKKDDRGQYRCEVNNAAGTAESSTQVIVQSE